MVLLTAAMIFAGFNKDIYFLVGFMSLGCVGIGSVLPCMDALITEGIEKENSGTITSLYSSMRFIGVSLGPPVVSLLMSSGHWVLFALMATVGAIGGLLTLFAVTPSKGSKGESGVKGTEKINPRLLAKRVRQTSAMSIDGKRAILKLRFHSFWDSPLDKRIKDSSYACGTDSQSFRKRSIPLSVSGCFQRVGRSEPGMVAM